MIPGPTPSGYAWQASPVQRARRAQAVAPLAPPKRQPFLKSRAELKKGSNSTLKTAAILEFPKPESFAHNEAAKPLEDHMFSYKAGCTLSDSATRLLRLKSWLEICANDRRYEGDAYMTECRLREQADFIIGWCA